MSEKRDLQEDKRVIAEYWEMDVIDDGEDIDAILIIAGRNTGRAITAEKERDELQKRVERFEKYLELIVYTTDNLIGGEAYSLHGHMNAVEYAKHILKDSSHET